ncbi:hypothetical protein CDAR_70811 [Caerostris darwini]|uniref:Uncharacterized protein n=1 Tax=Caerostris darwini TaxID=1538125 RepID=A0AAV4WGH2_9ARAC|nr:hypothetical protein CDAR_70811 [Caerostris darwini]
MQRYTYGELPDMHLVYRRAGAMDDPLNEFIENSSQTGIKSTTICLQACIHICAITGHYEVAGVVKAATTCHDLVESEMDLMTIVCPAITIKETPGVIDSAHSTCVRHCVRRVIHVRCLETSNFCCNIRAVFIPFAISSHNGQK